MLIKRDRFECKRKDLLVRIGRIDDQNASKVAERELHKSTCWWAYKCLNRFDKHGL